MLSVKVTIRGTEEELAKLHKLGDKLTNFESAMAKIGDEVKSYYVNDVFDSRGGAIGQKWVALSPVYKSWKLKHYRNGSANLIATGTMHDSFKDDSDRNSATISNDTTYFQYHQLGTRRMPARPVFVINKAVRDIVGTIVDEDIHKKLESL